MSHRHYLFAIATILASTTSMTVAQTAPSKPLREMRVLYVGNERAGSYINFLEEHVEKIEAVSRLDFQPKQASQFDVVLLDWPQGEEARDMRKLRSPLGARADWDRPTVLLGSAGLNLAVAWKLQGGSGCTCMDPIAYGFRDHEIFQHPKKIHLDAQIRISTPEAFKDDLSDKEVAVLPLVDDYKRSWNAGWCTYSSYFDKNPDVEFFCGGVNHKTPSAAGLWRQGNLLHFGFEQSPEEMNEHGRDLLLNSISYISRFSQDRPIAITPSVFGGEVAMPRRTPGAWLRFENRTAWVLEIFQPEARKVLESFETREAKMDWCNQNSKYFAPGPDCLLGIDEDLKAIGCAFDAPEFFERVIGDLNSNDSKVIERSRRLLGRYVTCGPGSEANAKEWRAWYLMNQPYLFGLDTGDYQWYVDELAKSRSKPTANFRGPLRADH